MRKCNLFRRSVVYLAFVVALGVAPFEVLAKKCKGNEIARAACKVKKAVGGASRTVQDVASRIQQASPVPLLPVAQLKVSAQAGQAVASTQLTVLDAQGKVVGNAPAEVSRAANAVNEALEAIEHYAKNQATATVSTLAAAERRVREGKVVDALWQLSIERTQATEENLTKATQESELLRTTAQVAASTLGPQGSAAFAAWYTYKQTGDFNLALKVGLISGAAGSGLGTANGLPSSDLARKTILAGAISGAAAAMAGGDAKAMLDAVVRGGGMVLVQDGYQRLTAGDVTQDSKPPTREPLCLMGSPGLDDCAPPTKAYLRNPEGELIVKDGALQIDTKFIPHDTSVVGLSSEVGKPNGFWGLLEQQLATDQGVAMRAVALLPGMNAMGLFHDQWMALVVMPKNFGLTQTTIIPATVLIYYGTAAPTMEAIQDAALKAKKKDDPSAAAPAMGDAASATPDVLIESDLSGPVGNEPEPMLESYSYICTKGDQLQQATSGIPLLRPELACAVPVERPVGWLAPLLGMPRRPGGPIALTGALHSGDLQRLRLTWYAQHESGYCRPKAVAEAAALVRAGWSCSVRDAEARTNALAGIKQ